MSMPTPQVAVVNHRDIEIFRGPIAFSTNPFYCSSLDGTRMISDVFDILDVAVLVGSSNSFILQEIDDGGTFLSTVYRRDALGTFKPGSYIILPLENGAEVFRRETRTFGSGRAEAPRPKNAKISDMGTEVSTVSTRDEGPRGFKMRLVHRDKGCVVCHANGTDSVYQYQDDSRFFEGAHIFPFERQSTWELRGYQNLITDPFTVTRPENTTRNKRDPLRINSLENGILLCLFHHTAYDTLRFSIHPTTHKIFAFHPAVANLHGLEVTSPWVAPDPMYPVPHHDLLEAHYQTSIFASLSAAAEPLGDDDDDDDEPELSEIPSNHNDEMVRIWVDDPNQYPPTEWRLDNEDQDNSSRVPKCKNVEVPLSDI